MSEPRFDLVVIGWAPAATSPRSCAAQLGMRVACVERYPTLAASA